MPRKRRQNNEGVSTDEVVKRVKSLMLEAIVREWLNAPCKEWGGKTPLQMIQKGEGKKIIEAIELSEKELKEERKPKKESNDIGRSQIVEGKVEESVSEEDHVLSRI